MSTRKHATPARAFRPEASDLESRRLLSGVVSGVDAKGDTWTLRLTGPGSLNVVKQDDSSGKPAALNSATDINTITIGGTDPTKSRLVGTVTSVAAGSDGRVFFQNLNELPSRSELFPSSGLGILSIDMPGFWLGNTTPSTSSSASTNTTANIHIPDGVDTLRFGGVDTTFNRTATTTGTSDNDTVELGLPLFGGTRILIDKSISSSEQFTSSSSGSSTTTTTQHGVEFLVAGRLELFQANEIDGDAAHPPGQFTNIPGNSTTASGAGGTLVLSSTPGFSSTSTFYTDLNDRGGVTGAIGNVRVGGNATNFSTVVFDPAFGGSDRIGNYSVGGETNNVLLVAPSGSRNVVFGKGMDNAIILSHVINTLEANRGAINSTVYSDRAISRVNVGGDVVGTTVLAGYQQNYPAIFDAVTGVSTSVFGGGTPSAPPVPENAQSFGGMTVRVAGDVSNSVFAASVEPFNNVFGDPNEIVLPGGKINAKVEGTIDNSTITPNTPTTAFFAKSVNALAGPVIPPNVPEAPYTGPQSYGLLPGVKTLRTPTPFTNETPVATSAAGAAAERVQAADALRAERAASRATPKGPLGTRTKKA